MEKNANLNQEYISAIYSCGSGGSGLLLQGNTYDYSELRACRLTSENLKSQSKSLLDFKEFAFGGTKALGLTSSGEAFEWGEVKNNQESNVILFTKHRISIVIIGKCYHRSHSIESSN